MNAGQDEVEPCFDGDAALTRELPAVADLFRSIAEHVADVVLLTTPDYVYRWASPSVRVVLGWEPEHFVGRQLQDFVTDETFALVDADRRRAIDGFATTKAFEYRKADGTYLPMRGSSYDLFDDDGNLIGHVVSLHDVSEEADARRELEASERRFRLLAENSIDVVVLASQDGILDWVSPSVTALLGFEPDEMVGHAFEEFVHPDDVTTVLDARARLGSDESATATLTVRMTTSLGGYHWVTPSIRRTPGIDGVEQQRVATWHDAQSEVEARQQLATLAMHDPLTGLSNRTQLQERMRQATTAARHTEHLTGGLMIDLDSFKSVNDRFGHAGGDAFLVEASRRLATCVREHDLVARVGGDEFVLLIRDLNDEREAMLLADRILDALRQPYLVGVHAETITSTVSIGVAVGPIDHLDTLQRKADEALYLAKSRGRDQAAQYVDRRDDAHEG